MAEPLKFALKKDFILKNRNPTPASLKRGEVWQDCRYLAGNTIKFESGHTYNDDPCWLLNHTYVAQEDVERVYQALLEARDGPTPTPRISRSQALAAELEDS